MTDVKHSFLNILWAVFCVTVKCSLITVRADGSRPLILPESDSLVMDVGATVNLTCRDKEPVVWATNQHKLVYTSYEELLDENNEKPYMAKLVIENVNYTNVGYYFCVRNTTENKEKSLWSPKDENVSSIYIYVKDLDHLLAQEAEQLLYQAVINKPFTFPCKPTFPEVKVTLDKWQGHFDPKEGFTLIADGSLLFLECKGVYKHDTTIRDFILTYNSREESLAQPNVTVKGYWQKDPTTYLAKNVASYDVVEGSPVYLNCSYKIDGLTHRYLNWEGPSSSVNESGNHFIFRYVVPSRIMAREYMIENASSERDSGNYSCRASNSQRDVTSEPTSVYINVMPLDYSNVTLVPDHPNITDIAEDELRWLVMYRAYPEPIFIWKKEGKLLVDSSRSDGDKRYKLEQKLQDGQIFLEISSPTTTDIGTYTLDAMIRKDDKIVAEHQVLLSYFTPVAPNFTVVEINPESPNGVIPFEETITMTCKSQGYPKPDLTLEFKQCFDSGNCTNFAPVSEDHTYSSSPSEETVVNATSVWSTKARIHGYYRCVGENRHGTQLSAAKEFSVAEGPHEVLSLEVMVNGDPKLGQETEVIEGDNVTIRCRGNKMRTSSNLEWTLNTSPLDLKDHPNTLLRQVDTDLSYVSEYVIKSITLQTTDLDFQCFDSQERGAVTRTRIYVNPMVAPSWKDDNLQQLNHDKKEMENLTLSCHATGAPSPQVSWYKDDVLLPETTSEADNKHRVVKGPEIHFKYLKLTDAGKYKCESINRAGMLSRTTTVAVTDPDANNFKSILIFIIIGSVLTIILIVLSVFYGRKLYLEKKRIIFCKLEEQKRFMEGNPEGLNPELGLELQAELLPYDIKYEFPRDSIIFDKLLGAGAFGRVYSATALNLIEGQLRTKVAVKMMKSRTDNAQRKALISEVKIMIHIGRHINIVNLLGACSKELSAKGELLLIVEYCKYGNILDYMRRHRKEFINQINDEDKIDPYLTGSRMRHRTESESRTRSFRGLKYAHLAFNQESVAYFPDRQLSDGTNSNHAWSEPQSPSATECQNGQFFDSQRTRNFSGISSINNENILSDMTTYTTESSNGGSEICNGSRSLGSNPITLTSTNILSWAYQIAKGMEYLAFKKVLHGDLAARNILLTDDNVVKISDFGLAKDIYKNANYTKKSKTPVPWKWLAPECIRDAVFSTQSDVWSYGVVLWEIFSLGNVPWPGIDFDNSFVVKLEKGVRLDQPRYATFDLYQVMMKCWDGDPINRPTFTDLENAISEMLSEAEKQRQLELNTPYQNENNASTFLNQLQSPDYNAKVRELSPNLDEDGYEMPFSPNACGAMAMPVPQISSPRLTPLQMQYQTNNTDESKSVYIPMSSPTKTSLNVFNFDKETVDAIEKRDSEIQDYEENKSMAGTPQETNYLFMHKNSPAPLTPVTPVTPVSSGNNVFSNTDIPLRPKGIRGLTLMNKHDSGLYSPTAYMQNNPQYVIPGPLGKTDENNYLTKDGCQDIFHDNKPNYINADCKSLPRNYTRQTSDGEYANLVPNGHGRGRTLSETSSGLGSISEESSPDMREKFEYMKSSVMEPAILEEPSQHSVQCQ